MEGAIEGKMSVRELVQVVRSVRREMGEKRGRPPTSSAAKAITRIENAALFFEEGTQLMSESTPTIVERRRLTEVLERFHILVGNALQTTFAIQKAGVFERVVDSEPGPSSGVHDIGRKVS